MREAGAPGATVIATRTSEVDDAYSLARYEGEEGASASP
jgi:hypothetical protein